MNPRGNLWYRFIRWVARNIGFRSLGGITSIDEHLIPIEGALIVAPNHMSFLDPPIIACSQRRAVAFMSKEELFRVFLLGPLIRSLGAFPLQRGASDLDAIRRAIGVLKQGKALLVFPEGTRGDGTSLGPITSGVAALAKSTGAKVMPVGIVGTQIVLPKGRSRPKRHPMTVVFGTPFTYDEVASSDSPRENRELIRQRLEHDLIALCERGGLTLRTSQNSPDSTASDRSETAPGATSPEQGESQGQP